MIFKVKVFICTGIMAVLICFSGSVQARDKWGYTLSDFIIKHKLSDKLALKFNYNMATKEDKRPCYSSYYRLGLAYSPYYWLELTPAYQYGLNKQDAGDWDHENRFLFDVTLKWKAAGLKFQDRNRMEWRFFDIRPDSTYRYRNEFKISKPVEFMGMKFTPYISNEIWYDLSGHSAQINWAAAGVSKKIMDNVLLSVFYRLESFKTGNDWSESNFIGTTIILFL